MNRSPVPARPHIADVVCDFRKLTDGDAMARGLSPAYSEVGSRNHDETEAL